MPIVIVTKINITIEFAYFLVYDAAQFGATPLRAFIIGRKESFHKNAHLMLKVENIRRWMVRMSNLIRRQICLVHRKESFMQKVHPTLESPVDKAQRWMNEVLFDST